MADPTQRRHLTDKEIGYAAKLTGLGLPQNLIASFLGISRDTYQKRLKDQDGVAQAIEKGKADAAGKVINTAFEMATDKKNTAMTIFWLKTQLKWSEIDKDSKFYPVEDPESLT